MGWLLFINQQHGPTLWLLNSYFSEAKDTIILDTFTYLCIVINFFESYIPTCFGLL